MIDCTYALASLSLQRCHGNNKCYISTIDCSAPKNWTSFSHLHVPRCFQHDRSVSVQAFSLTVKPFFPLQGDGDDHVAHGPHTYTTHKS